MGNTIIYYFDDSLYINVTNRCTNDCDFCIRNNPPDSFTKFDLWLSKEPSVEEIIMELNKFDLKNYKEIVFCGYGEPLMRFDEVIEVCKYIRSIATIPIRINTNGQANLYHGKDITYLMKDLVDICSISLNASNAKDYDIHCKSDFGIEAYAGILDFAKQCSKYVQQVVFSVVDVMDKEEIEICRKIALDAGVGFRVRTFV